MSKSIRSILSLVVSLVLFSTLTMAQTGGNANNNKDKNSNSKDKNSQAQHSRLAKAAFWRHHKDSGKNEKQAQAQQASKPAPAKTAQLKPVSAKVSAGKKDQKPESHASNVSKPSAKKAPAAIKTKPQPKAQDPKTASLKQ
jgi:hypothetical protein